MNVLFYDQRYCFSELNAVIKTTPGLSRFFQWAFCAQGVEQNFASRLCRTGNVNSITEGSLVEVLIHSVTCFHRPVCSLHLQLYQFNRAQEAQFIQDRFQDGSFVLLIRFN